MMASSSSTTSPATLSTEIAGNSNESFEEADESASAAAAPRIAKSRVKRNIMLNYPGQFQHFGYRTDFGKRAPAWPLPNTYQHFGYRTDFGKRWLHLPASSSKPSRSVVIRQPQHFGYRTDFGKRKRSLVTSAKRIIAVLRKGSSGYYWPWPGDVITAPSSSTAREWQEVVGGVRALIDTVLWPITLHEAFAVKLYEHTPMV